MKGRRPGPRCAVAVRCGGVDVAGAGECEALTGRWWRAAVGAQSSVKCVCSSEHNTGLPSHRGKHVPALDHCCMWLFHIYWRFFFYHYYSVPVFYTGTITADFVLLPYDAKPAPLHVFLIHHSGHQVWIQQTLSNTSAFMSQSVLIWHLSREALWLWDSCCSTDRSIQYSGNATRHGCRTLKLNAQETTQILKYGDETPPDFTPC